MARLLAGGFLTGVVFVLQRDLSAQGLLLTLGMEGAYKDIKDLLELLDLVGRQAICRGCGGLLLSCQHFAPQKGQWETDHCGRGDGELGLRGVVVVVVVRWAKLELLRRRGAGHQ